MADTKSNNSAGDSNSVQGVLNVTKEDQQKINQFARLNARLEDAKDEINSKTSELKNYEDAMSEAELKVLEDEGHRLHLQVGDIMVNLEPEKTLKWIEGKMDVLKTSLVELEKKKANIVEEMTGLKAHLYARFGNNIHLESGP